MCFCFLADGHGDLCDCERNEAAAVIHMVLHGKCHGRRQDRRTQRRRWCRGEQANNCSKRCIHHSQNAEAVGSSAARAQCAVRMSVQFFSANCAKTITLLSQNFQRRLLVCKDEKMHRFILRESYFVRQTKITQLPRPTVCSGHPAEN